MSGFLNIVEKMLSYISCSSGDGVVVGGSSNISNGDGGGSSGGGVSKSCGR